MVVLSPSVSGIAVAPFTGKMPCGFMRASRHHCEDSSCPLNRCLVMAFDPQIIRAIDSCRRLWDLDEKTQLVCCRLEVLADTLRIGAEELEEGIVSGNPADWARLKAAVNEHEKAAVQLTSVSALISFRHSPGAMWQAGGSPFVLPAGIELRRPALEHHSWWDAELPDPGSLLEDLDRWEDEEGGEA